MNMFRKLFSIPRNDRTSEGDATALMLARVFSLCPICDNKFAKHTYALFATTTLVEGETQRLVEFFKAHKDHRWHDAKGFQKWESIRDNIETYIIRCSTGQMIVVIVRSPEEFYESDQLVEYEVLTLEQSRELNSFIEEEKWHPIL